jgi:hypothetical protein
MPYINRFLLALKIARKLNDSYKKPLSKIDLNSRIFYKRIFKFLNINLNKFDIYELPKLSNNYKANLLNTTDTNIDSKLIKITETEAVNHQSNNVIKNINSLGYHNQDNYIVNNLLLQKLIVSNYNLKNIRSNLLRYRLSYIFKKGQEKDNQNNINDFRIRKPIINLYKGSSNKNGFRIVSGSGHNVRVQYRKKNSNFNKSDSILLEKGETDNRKIKEIKNTPNLRNLRIILQRLIISKYKFKRGYNNGFNLKFLLPINNIQNQKKIINNNVKGISKSYSNIIYNNKNKKTNQKTPMLSQLPQTQMSKLNNNKNNIKNSILHTLRTPEYYKNLFLNLSSEKENNKIKKISNSLLYNHLYRFRRLMFNKQITRTNKFINKNLSKYLPIVENTNYLFSKFSRSINSTGLSRLSTKNNNRINNKGKIPSYLMKFYKKVDTIKNIISYFQINDKNINLNSNNFDNSLFSASASASATSLKNIKKNNKRSKKYRRITRNVIKALKKINNKKYTENFRIIKNLFAYKKVFKGLFSKPSIRSLRKTNSSHIHNKSGIIIRNNNSNSNLVNLKKNSIFNNDLNNSRLRKNYLNYMLQNYMLNLVRYQDNSDFSIKTNFKDYLKNFINPMNFLSSY